MTNETELATGSATTTSVTAARRRSRGIKLFIRDILFILLAALVISFLIKTFLIRSFYIPSPSMENTLQVNDRVIVSLLTPSLVPLQRGDVVVFTDPGGWLTPVGEQPAAAETPWDAALAFVGLSAPDDNNHLIKRVIGLPGDHVSCCSSQGDLKVNGVAIKEPYIVIPSGSINADKYTFSITVPKGDIWVMGDNRYASADSAFHYYEHDVSPFVPISDVTGQAFVISWPTSHWSWLGNYPAVFADTNKKSK